MYCRSMTIVKILYYKISSDSLLMDINNFSSLFEILIGINFAYAGLDSFSETTLIYVYTNSKKIKEIFLAKLNNIKLLSQKFLNDDYEAILGESNSLEEAKQNGEKLKNNHTRLQTSIQRFEEELDALSSSTGNITKIKKILYGYYDSNKFKPLFTILGFYFGMELLIVCSISGNDKNYETNCLNGMILSNIVMIIFNLITCSMRLKKDKYKSVKYYSLIPIISIILILCFSAIYSITQNCVCEHKLFYLFQYLNVTWLISVLFLSAIPFVFEIIALYIYLRSEVFNLLENKLNRLTIQIKQKDDSNDDILNTIIQDLEKSKNGK